MIRGLRRIAIFVIAALLVAAIPVGLWLADLRRTADEAAALRGFSVSAGYATAERPSRYRNICEALAADRDRLVRERMGLEGRGTQLEMSLRISVDRQGLFLVKGADYCRRYTAFDWAQQYVERGLPVPALPPR